MKNHGSANEGMRGKLQSFLKGVRVRVIHLPEEKNKAGSTIPRIKTILGLTTKNDGQNLDHPPKISNFGAGPKDVEFFLDSPAPSSSAPVDSTSDEASVKGNGKKGRLAGGKPVFGASRGIYISVFDFFELSESISGE